MEILTRPGCMHKSNTDYDEEQHSSIVSSSSSHTDPPPTETEQKTLHFFETGIEVESFSC